MQITQNIINIARSKLPPALGLQMGAKCKVEVNSIEAGITHRDNPSMGVVTVSFFVGHNGWEHYDLEHTCKPTLNVVDLKPTVKDSGAHVIERLEQALAMAKEGYVSNVAVLIVQENGDVMDCWANGSSPFTMVGGLESLKFEFMSACIEPR